MHFWSEYIKNAFVSTSVHHVICLVHADINFDQIAKMRLRSLLKFVRAFTERIMNRSDKVREAETH